MNKYFAHFVRNRYNQISETVPGDVILAFAVDAVDMCRRIGNIDDFWVHVGQESQLLVITALKTEYNENRLYDLLADWEGNFCGANVDAIEFDDVGRTISANDIEEAAKIAITAIEAELAEEDKK